MLPVLYPPRPEGTPSYFEPGDGKSYLETLHDWTPSLEGVGRLAAASASPEGRDLTSAAADSSALNRYLSSRDRALEEATDLRIDAVKRATGVELQNPYRNGYNVEARARVAARRFDPDFDPRAGIPGAARDIFNEQIAAVADKHGDKVADLDLQTPIEDKARALATVAEDSLPGVRARSTAGGMSPQQQMVLESVGAMGAGLKDPLTLFSLAAGPGFGIGRTAAMRVITEAVGQGSFNVGLLLAEHPAIEAWRQERGRAPGGHLPSLAETSIAFLSGAIPGAGTRILFELLPKVRPDITPEVIRAAERAGEADRVMAEAIPAAVPREAGEEALAQSARHAADPAHEPPPSPIVSHETSGERSAELADIVRRADSDPVEMVEAMRAEIAVPATPALRGGYTDSRGKGVQFHGAPNEVSLAEGNYGSSTAFYGTHSLYTSDALDVVHGYANKRGAKAPSIYEAIPLKEGVPSRDVKIYDMEAPIHDDVRSKIDEIVNDPHGQAGEVAESALSENPKNLREFFDEARSYAASERIPADEIQEGLFHPIADFLSEHGYHGMSHVGGLRTKTPAHNVVIYFNPEQNVKLRKMSAAELEGLKTPLAEAALASGDENLVNAAKMASLSEPAWQAVKDGRVSPGNALITAEHAPNPSDHLPVLERLEKEAPQTSKEARVIAADEVAGQASKSEAVALQAQVAEKPRIGTVPEERRSLLQFLAGRGGVAHTDELRALFGDRSSYIRPYGKLLKEDAEQLAVRAEQAFAAGYIAEPSERALLAAIKGEVEGAKVYRAEFAAQGAERDVAKATTKEAKAAKEQARTDLFNYLAETGSEIRPSFPGSEVSNRRIFKEAVGLLARGEETDVAAALRRAASEEFQNEGVKATRRKATVKEDPMDTIPSPTDDGGTALLSREETAARLEDRQSLADLVRACKE